LKTRDPSVPAHGAPAIEKDNFPLILTAPYLGRIAADVADSLTVDPLSLILSQRLETVLVIRSIAF
jgi:hypothetical protein